MRASSIAGGAGPRLPGRTTHSLVVDSYAGWDPEYRVKVRIICSRAYHALFMHNLAHPADARGARATFGKPDFLIINAGDLPADPLGSRRSARGRA